MSDTSTAGYFIEILFLFCFHCFVSFLVGTDGGGGGGTDFSGIQAVIRASQCSGDSRTWERNGCVAPTQAMQARHGHLSAN